MLPGFDPIFHTEYIEERRSVNRALEGHRFYPGTVTHEVFFDNGVLVYDITGEGSGDDPQFNNFLGTALFFPSALEVRNLCGINGDGSKFIPPD